MYYIVTPLGHRCGPIATRTKAHNKGVMWYGTGNFEIVEDAPKDTPKAPPKTTKATKSKASDKPDPLEGDQGSAE